MTNQQIRTEISKAILNNSYAEHNDVNIREVSTYLNDVKNINVSHLPQIQNIWHEELNKFRCEG